MTLSESNAGQFGGAVLQSILLARDLTELLRPGVPSAVPTGTSSGSCPLGGSATTQVSGDRLTMTETFSNCVVQSGVNPVTFNGERQFVWSGPAQSRAFAAIVTLTDFRAAVTGGPSEEIDGTINYDGGVMTATSATDGIRVTYQFDVFAADSSGLVSNDALAISFSIYLDSDLDGQADSFDDDDDNDGVRDSSDDFPLDPLESSDADNDGIGDNGDPDDDNDGTPDVDDAYPLDGRCFIAADGDGTRCLLSTFASNSTVFADRNGVAYIHYYFGFVADRFKVYRYDTTTGHFLSTIELDPGVVGLVGPEVPFSVTYAEDHHALYVMYDNTGVTRISLDDPNLTETLFKMKEPSSTYMNLAWDYGTYVVIAEQSQGMLHRYSYTEAGTLIDSYDKPDVTGAIIYVGPHNDKYCDEGVALDLQTGMFFQFNNPGQINCRILGEPAPLPDGSIALQGVNIIDQSLTVLATIQMQGQDRRRRSFNNLGVFALSGDGVEVFTLDGAPVEIINPVLPQSSGFSLEARASRDVTIIIEKNGGFLIERYIPLPP